MVAFLPILSAVVGLFAAVTVFQPKLPKYHFKIRTLWPKWCGGWTRPVFKARVKAGIQLQNDNHVPIDIHALSVDLFYQDWSGKWNHMATVEDEQQQQPSPPAADKTSKDNKNENASKEVIWNLGARQVFETYDAVYVQSTGGMGVMTSIGWDIVKHVGQIDLPTSGVLHVKAHSKVPLTLGIMCDNSLSTFRLELQGLSCSLAMLEMGWVDMETSMSKLRSKMTNEENPAAAKTSHIKEPELTPDSFAAEYDKVTKKATSSSRGAKKQKKKKRWLL